MILKKRKIITLLFRLQLIPLLLALIYVGALSPEYLQSRITPFSKLGFFSVVEGSSVKIKGGKELRQKQIIRQRVLSTENNLGIVLVRFTNFNRYNTDKVEFRIREESKTSWMYTQAYAVDQFQNNQYFTFGFPLVRDSEGKYYEFEIESLSGNNGNAAGISKINPQIALVYKFTKEELRASPAKTIIRIGWKKIVYTLLFIDYRVPIYVYIISLLFIASLRYRTRLLHFIIGTIKHVSTVWLKINKIKLKNTPLVRFYKAFEKYSINTILHSKHRIAVLIILFFTAFLVRVLFYLDLDNYRTTFFYQLGSGGDYEMLIKHSSLLFSQGNYGFWQNWWDWLFITRILAFFFYFFGFIGGLAATELLMVIMGSFVAILPYYLLSRKHWFSVGGILGSLLLCVNPLQIMLSLGYMIDTSAMYLYSLFIAVYFMAYERRTIYWLCLLGFTVLTNGLNKVIWLLNDPLTLIAFIPLYSITSLQLSPRLRIHIERKFVKAAAIPFFFFTTLYCLWEFFIMKTIHRYYYLGDVFFSNGGGSKDYLHESLGKNVSIFQKAYILFEFSIRAIDNLNTNLHIPHTVLWIIIGLLIYAVTRSYSKRFELIKHVGFIIFFVSIIGFMLNIFFQLPFEKYYIAGMYVTIVILSFLLWPFEVLKYLVLIGPYFIILINVVTTLPLPRLYGQVVLWSALFLGFIIDQMIEITRIKKRQHIPVVGVLSVVICIIFILPALYDLSVNGIVGFQQRLENISYFRWVNNSTPPNTILLSSEGDDLLLMGLVLNKPFVYNSRFGGALLIRKNYNPAMLTTFGFPQQIGNPHIFSQYTYVVTDANPVHWIRRIWLGDDIFSVNGPIFINRYRIYQYAYNSSLKRILYKFDTK